MLWEAASCAKKRKINLSRYLTGFFQKYFQFSGEGAKKIFILLKRLGTVVPGLFFIP